MPKFKPLPSELTPAVINGATLPVKVEAAKRAIAACCDLSELLTWKDKLAALAAAAKMAKMPELSRDVNRVHKEAIFRMGELLLQYSSGATLEVRTLGTGRTGELHVPTGPGERARVAKQLGISKAAVAWSTRLARNATPDQRERILATDSVGPAPARMVNYGKVAPMHPGKKKDSEAAAIFLRGYNPRTGAYSGHSGGLGPIATHLKSLDLSPIASLTQEEKQRAKKYIIEMQEILDAMMQRLELTGAS